jgi:3-dehydroquinate dehydratase-2
MKILIINGPNLNLLGVREPEIYGTMTLQDIENILLHNFPQTDFEFFQSNSEGVLIDKLQSAKVEGAVFNPGAFSHYSYALFDCVKGLSYPVIEVHLSNISAREEFRRKSLIAPACKGAIYGLGVKGYELAVRALIDLANK